MSKTKNCNNEQLLAALKDREQFIKDMDDEVFNYSDYDDEQLNKYKTYMKKVSQLSQFEKDVWYLKLHMSVADIAKLYAISETYIYRTIKNMKLKTL